LSRLRPCAGPVASNGQAQTGGDGGRSAPVEMLSEVGTSYDDFRWCQAPLMSYAAFWIFLLRAIGGITRFLAYTRFEYWRDEGEEPSRRMRGFLGWLGLT
jgi:hypothetical protein